MKALITGDRGFVGRHFSVFLKERDWEVYGLDILNGKDEDALPYFLENDDEQFDLLIHCAYEVGGRAHINGTNMALAHNVGLDAAMFRWAVNGGARAVLYFSSSAAYPIQEQTLHNHRRLNEGLIYLDDMRQPDSNYGWAKLTGERLARDAEALGLRVHIVRPFSGYGSDQGLEYPFPSIVKRAIMGELEVWGPSGQTRDWIHIKDVVEGAFQVYEQDVRTPVNICSGIATEMGYLSQRAYFLSRTREPKKAQKPVTYLEDKPTGVFYRVGDPTKFFQIYRPKVSLDEGIQEAIDFFRG